MINTKNKFLSYDNDLNTVAFGNFSEKELDLFFSICFKIKEENSTEVTITFQELKQLSNYVNRNLSRFVKDLENTYDKMLRLNIKIRHLEMSFTKFNLFNKYTVNVQKKTVTIKVSEEFEYLLNHILNLGNYTKFDLIDFVNLRSSYCKNMFRLLKQWESVRKKEFLVTELRELLKIPDSYRMSEIDKYILKPVMKELPKYFTNLKIEKIKTGRKITQLKFTWNGKKELIESPKEIKIKLSEEIDSILKKVSKNRFIKKILTNDIIKYLTETFEEKDLKKGLLWAYKEINKDISSINYLIKTIKTGAMQPEKRIIVKKESLITNQMNISKKNKEKSKITRKNYEKIYKKYLADNKTEDNIYVRRSFDKIQENNYIIIDLEEDLQKLYDYKEKIKQLKNHLKKELEQVEKFNFLKEKRKIYIIELQKELQEILNHEKNFDKYINSLKENKINFEIKKLHEQAKKYFEEHFYHLNNI